MVAPTLTDIQLSKWRMRIPTNQREATKMKITTVGIDLAKNVFQVHGVDQRGNRASQKLAKIPGIGPLTASALSASIGDAKAFRNGRELAAWLGLVPRQHSSGGKPLLLGISKRGDAYLRALMIHGARSVIRVARRKLTATDRWSTDLLERRHTNVAAVARANKNARIVWALLAHGRDYRADYELAA